MDPAVWLLSPSTDVCAAIHPNMRISLYAASSDAAVSRQTPRILSETLHASAQAYVQSRSAHAWGPASSPADGLLAVGTAGGAIVLWDTATAEVAARLGHNEGGVKSSAGAITALAWAPDGATLYSSATGSGVITAHTLTLSRGSVGSTGVVHVACDKRGCTALAVSPDGSLLLAGHSVVSVIATRNMATLARLAGHAGAVTTIAIAADSQLVLTGGGEANVCVWDAASASSGTHDAAPSSEAVWSAFGAAAGGKPVSTASHVLLHPHGAVPHLSVLRAPRKKDTYHVASHTSDGEVLLWRYRRGGHGKASSHPHARLRPTPAAEALSVDAVALVDAPARSGLDAGSETAARGRVSLAVAAHSRTHACVVWSVPFLTSEGHIDKDTVLTMPAVAAPVTKEGTHAAKLKAAATAAAAAAVAAAKSGAAGPVATGRLHANEHVQSNTRSHAHAGEMKQAAPIAPAAIEEEVTAEAAEPSLGERVDALVQSLTRSRTPAATLIAAAAPHTAAATKAAAPRSSGAVTSSVPASMTVTLVQALQAGDNATVDDITAHSDSRLIAGTVERLPHACVVPLLTRLCARVQSQPAHAAVLIPWLRACLCTHTGTLLTLPHCVDVLSPLYTLLDARMHVYKKVFKLSGRLELLLSQSSARAHGAPQKRPRMAVSQADLERGRPASAVVDAVTSGRTSGRRRSRRRGAATAAALQGTKAVPAEEEGGDEMEDGVFARANAEEDEATGRAEDDEDADDDDAAEQPGADDDDDDEDDE